jgi:hypothetical protein
MRALALVLVIAGCAPAISGFQPAHVAPKGSFSAEVGWDVSAPTGTILRSIDAGRTLARAAGSRSLSDAERRQLIEAGANLALDPPALVMHLGLTYSPATDWEVGLRWSSDTWRVGGRHQFLHQETDGIDLSAGLGLSRFSASFPVDDIIDVIHVNDFTRWSLDIPLLLGKHGPWYRLWGGPRLLLSRFDSSMTLDLPAAAGAPAEMVLASVEGNAVFVGGQGGLALGYRHLFLAFELTIVRLVSTARLSYANQLQDADLGGLVISPGIALMGEL